MFKAVDSSKNSQFLKRPEDLLGYMRSHGFYATSNRKTKLSEEEAISVAISQGHIYLHIDGDFEEVVTYTKTREESTAYIMIGIPGSGKSTLASSLKDVTVVSLDFLRERGIEDWKSFQEEFWSLVESAPGDVVLDNTHYRPKYRKQAIKRLSNLGFRTIIGLYVLSTVEQAMENQELRERKVPLEVVSRMAEVLRDHPPSLQEGFTEILKGKITNSQ